MPLPFLYAENIFGTVSTLDTFSMLLIDHYMQFSRVLCVRPIRYCKN